MSAMDFRRERWASEILSRLELGNNLEFTVAQFARQLGDHDVAGLEKFLDELVDAGSAAHVPAYICPVSSCARPLPSADALTECPYCRTDYREHAISPAFAQFYRLNGQLSRDIRWMIVIHGMNSRAPWQEAFTWEITSRLKHSAPVLIYKYGWATIEVLLTFTHRRMAKRLGRRISLAIDQAAQVGRTERPDVIAHSFGTRLLSLVLDDPEFADLKLGRIITAGSIVRPDFDWARHLREDRVEALFNHVAAKDTAVPFAEWTIPGSGPGGKIGYTSPEVFNVRNSSFGHSDFFLYQNMAELIKKNGLWYSFLTRPLGFFAPQGRFSVEKRWRAKSPVVMFVPRLAMALLFLVALPFSALRRIFDP
ncbi:hypothetical protein [Pseudomonas sp. Q2-TVG4-2]|uniref:hypothetical protein n=1 Tax=Pseudomonas sp. Q2-TVG4-2 TaxID=1685699 RepID=UPI0015E71533|nr:hypothetical protein [Pseudomonas sp. Q2-TVG4-2]